MSQPKLNSMVFCIKAVHTEPWWNLIGVFDTCLANDAGEAEFDVFIKLGDMPSDHDSTITLSFVDPSNLDVLGEFSALIRGGSDRVAERVVPVTMVFPRKGDYHVEVHVGASLIDVLVLRVYVTG